MGTDTDDKFVYVNIVCFDVGCFSSTAKMYAPRDHLRKGAIRPHYDYY